MEHIVKGKSLKDIARESGFPYDDVYQAMLSCDLRNLAAEDLRGTKSPLGERMKKANVLLTRGYIMEEYYRNGRSLAEIAKNCGCSRQYVYKRAIDYAIPLRGKRYARSLAYERGKIAFERTDEEGNRQTVTLQKNTYNETFFSSWSAKMAYVLGVIYTDGNLSPQSSTCSIGRLTLAQKEPELLEKVLALMGCNARLLYRKEIRLEKTTAGAVHYFHITNDKIYTDLIELGLMPNKSRSIKFPQIPPEYVRHFIRGCWDGDGSFYYEKPRGGLKGSFVSGSLEFIKGIVNELERAGLSRRTIHATKGKSPSYYLKLNRPDCVKLYHYLYDHVPESQYLRRKYDINSSAVKAYEVREKFRQALKVYLSGPKCEAKI